MADYSQLKVPDLRKVLQERGLTLSGNKADLIARLQEDDKKAGAATAGEDEIDWDEDDKTAPAQAAAKLPAPKVEPPTTTDPKKAEGEAAPADGAAAPSTATKTEAVPAPEAPKADFSIGIQKTDAEKESERRAARAKRFGVTEDDEAKKLAARAKKFGLDTAEAVVGGLDAALPERRQKRGREDKQGGRNAKRQTPDRRTGPGSKPAAAPKTPPKAITDDPAEKARAEARAKRFGAV